MDFFPENKNTVLVFVKYWKICVFTWCTNIYVQWTIGIWYDGDGGDGVHNSGGVDGVDGVDGHVSVGVDCCDGGDGVDGHDSDGVDCCDGGDG